MYYFHMQYAMLVVIRDQVTPHMMRVIGNHYI